MMRWWLTGVWAALFLAYGQLLASHHIALAILLFLIVIMPTGCAASVSWGRHFARRKAVRDGLG
jgi:hypothetical protein